MSDEKQAVTPEQAVKILQKHNVKVTVEQAKKILEFMNIFAKLAVNQYVK
jgi:hypothetical protein